MTAQVDFKRDNTCLNFFAFYRINQIPEGSWLCPFMEYLEFSKVDCDNTKKNIYQMCEKSVIAIRKSSIFHKMMTFNYLKHILPSHCNQISNLFFSLCQ